MHVPCILICIARFILELDQQFRTVWTEMEHEERDSSEYDSEKEVRKHAMATYQTKFKDEWKKEFVFILSVCGDLYLFRCNLCCTSILCHHLGKRDVKAHCKSAGHLQKAKALDKQHWFEYEPAKANLDKNTMEAEVKMAVLGAHVNIPIAFHDKVSPAIRSQFSNHKVAAQYHSASTKAMCMLNGAVAPLLISDLVAKLKMKAFSLMVDESNDTGLENKTMPIFDVNRVKTSFLDMCPTTSSTAEAIFTSMDSRLVKLLNPWMNCTAVGVDSTSVNIGVRNSLKTRI